MGTFRSLTVSDLEEILNGFAIRGYRSHSAIAAGTINTNVALEVTDGLSDVRRFLRVNEGKAIEDVEREIAIVEHLADRGVPTPRPLPARGGQRLLVWRGVCVSMFPWIEGRTLTRAEVTAAHAHDAGIALARMHLAGADYADHRPGRYEPDEIDRRLVNIRAAASQDPALAAAVAELAPELARVRSARIAALPLGLIHGDLFIDNVLYKGTTLSALLDFEQASWGRLAYDLAVSVLAFGFGNDDFRPDVTRAFIDGYCETRPVSEAERAGFADELCFACCRFAVTRITDVYMRRTAGAPGGKDFRRYLQRLRAVKLRRELGDALLRLP